MCKISCSSAFVFEFKISFTAEKSRTIIKCKYVMDLRQRGCVAALKGFSEYNQSGRNGVKNELIFSRFQAINLHVLSKKKRRQNNGVNFEYTQQ